MHPPRWATIPARSTGPRAPARKLQDDHVNQRQAQAGANGETDGLIESFEKLDKDVRAERDLGKGNRSSKQ